MTATRRRVLILTADAGLGHRSAAEAIAKALRQQYSDACEVTVANVFDEEGVPDFLRETQTDYDRIVQEMPELYRLGYEIGDTPIMATALQRVVGALISDQLDSVLRRHIPNVIVSTYPLYQGVLEEEKPHVPYITTITDLTAIHNVWFSPHIDLCVVPTESAKKQAIEAGVPEERVELIGIPVDPALAEDHDPVALRGAMEWAPERTTVLAVGGKRVGNLLNVLHVLNHSGFSLQLALVAGKNADLHRRFQEIEWHLPTKIYGFVDNMPEMMHASDLILCKAGGLIVSEALAAGLPLLLVDALPGQETGNVEYVVGGGAGALAQEPIDALETLAHWLDKDGTLLEEMTRHASRLGTPHAAIKIARHAWDLAA